MSLHGRPLLHLARDLASGSASSRSLVESALEAISADQRAFARVDAHAARATADAIDGLRRAGAAPSAYAGVPISIKDLFDIAGQPTPAGSAVLRDAEPAARDAAPVARLRKEGFVFIGRTHMSEFAFTGLGLNPHAPRLPNALDPVRAPGGSSSGAAVSVALGQAAAGLGTDTGGSVRIPAAFNNLVGFKPTQRRVSREGVFPLCPSLDSVGPIAWSTSCCGILDAILSGDADAATPSAPHDVAGLRLAVLEGYPTRDLDAATATAFEAAISRLSAAGAKVTTLSAGALERLPEINARGALANAEAFALHRRLGLLDQAERYDPHVLSRIALGGKMSAADYLDVADALNSLRLQMAALTREFDAVMSPTVARRAPTFEEVSDPQVFAAVNALVLRNTGVANVLDRCAISLPGPDGVGVMLMGETLGDRKLLRLAEAVEPILR